MLLNRAFVPILFVAGIMASCADDAVRLVQTRGPAEPKPVLVVSHVVGVPQTRVAKLR